MCHAGPNGARVKRAAQPRATRSGTGAHPDTGGGGTEPAVRRCARNL